MPLGLESVRDINRAGLVLSCHYQALMTGPVTERQPSIKWGRCWISALWCRPSDGRPGPAGGRAGAVVWVGGRRERERAQAGVDEPGGAADVGADQFMDPGRC